jgi:hypothetical protein
MVFVTQLVAHKTRTIATDAKIIDWLNPIPNGFVNTISINIKIDMPKFMIFLFIHALH